MEMKWLWRDIVKAMATELGLESAEVKFYPLNGDNNEQSRWNWNRKDDG